MITFQIGEKVEITIPYKDLKPSSKPIGIVVGIWNDSKSYDVRTLKGTELKRLHWVFLKKFKVVAAWDQETI